MQSMVLIGDVWSEKQLEIFKIIAREYWVNKKIIKEINKKYHINTLYWMKKFKIPRRDKNFDKIKDWDDLSYTNKHFRMRKLIPHTPCVTCGKEYDLKPHAFEITNLNHEYNNILEEWVWMCNSHHKKHDFNEGLIVCSEERNKKVSEAKKKYHKENPTSQETRKKISEALKNKPKTEEHKRNISKSLKGKNNPNYKHGKYC